MTQLRRFIQPLLVVLVLALGVGALMYFRSTRPTAARSPRPSESLLVEVQRVRAGRHPASVLANGTVIPASQVVVQAQVSGSIVWQNPELVPGGKLEKGAALLRIDPRDYDLAIEARRAEVSRAELELQLEQGRKQVAEREWELFEAAGQSARAGAGSQDALALRGPQVRTAQVGVQSAQSALNRAALDLSRTTLRAPFNALVMEERVDLGQQVSPQTSLATLVGSDEYWVQVSVPIEALSHIAIPGAAGRQKGARVQVSQQVGGTPVQRSGEVVRLLPDLDAGGAMARLLVEVDDPLGLELEGPALPLLLNAYVNVEIEATTFENVVELPRFALRDGDRAFVVDAGERLRIVDLQVVWRYPQSVLVQGGLKDGDEVVISRIAAPVDGMTVRKVTASATRAPDVAPAQAETVDVGAVEGEAR